MGIQVYRDISVDFSNGRYIIMNAKQHDSNSRFIRMTCLNCGQKVNLNPDNYSAFIRYRKSDGYGVFNKCIISTEGQVIFELTEQMLSTVGTSYADLVVIDVAKDDINNDLTIISKDGRIIENNSSLASTMTFYINVLEKPLNDWDIESTNEFSALNDLLLRASKDYEYIVQTTKTHMDSARASANAAAASVNAAKVSENKAKTSEINAESSEKKALNDAIAAFNSALLSKSYAMGESGNLTNEKWEEIITSSKEYIPIEIRKNESVDNAKYYKERAAFFANKANTSAIIADEAKKEIVNAKILLDNIKQSEDNAKLSEINALKAQEVATVKAQESKTSEANAEQSEIQSGINVLSSQSYAIGGASDMLIDNEENNIIASDGSTLHLSFYREGENTDNAKYYYEQTKMLIDNIDSVVKPYKDMIVALTTRVMALEEIIFYDNINLISNFVDNNGDMIVTNSGETIEGRMLII